MASLAAAARERIAQVEIDHGKGFMVAESISPKTMEITYQFDSDLTDAESRGLPNAVG